MFIARRDNRAPAPVGASWQRIETWFRARQPEVVESLQCGASEEQLSDFERSTGLTLPDDVKASYRIHDGQKDRYCPGLLLGAGLSSLAEVRHHWEFFAGLEVEYSQWDVSNDADEDCSSFPEGAIRLLDVNSRWIPLFNWDGNCYGIDLDPGLNGVRGQVINFGRDQSAKLVLALSWAHFLEDIADEMEAGSIVLVWDDQSESHRLTRAGEDDVGFFHYCEDWALAKLPTEFREAECKLFSTTIHQTPPTRSKRFAARSGSTDRQPPMSATESSQSTARVANGDTPESSSCSRSQPMIRPGIEWHRSGR